MMSVIKKTIEDLKTLKSVTISRLSVIREIVFPHTIRVGLKDNSHFNATISGSIHHTHEGKSYLVAGSNVTITSGSNGQVTIASSGGGSSGITVQDEGSTLSTLGTTLNFVGTGIAASGTGGTKTITVNNSTTTQHVQSFYLGFSPGAGITQTYYGKWNDGSIQSIDPDQTASNFIWKYYPYGGEIKKVYAIGSARSDSDDNFPTIWQSRDIVFAIYNFEDTDGAGADLGGTTTERVPKFHVTSSYSGGDFDLLIARKTGSTTRYKRCGVTFDLSSGTGSTSILAGDSIAFGFKGEDTGRLPFEYIQFFIEWDENIS